MSIYKKQAYYVGWGLLAQLAVLVALFVDHRFYADRYSGAFDSAVLWTAVLVWPILVAGPLGGWKFNRFENSILTLLPINPPVLTSLLIAGLTVVQIVYAPSLWLMVPAFLFAALCAMPAQKCPRCNMPIGVKTLSRRNPGRVEEWNYIEYKATKCGYCMLELSEDYFSNVAEVRKSKREQKLAQKKLTNTLSDTDIFKLALGRVASARNMEPNDLIDELNQADSDKRNKFLNSISDSVNQETKNIKAELGIE